MISSCSEIIQRSVVDFMLRRSRWGSQFSCRHAWIGNSHSLDQYSDTHQVLQSKHQRPLTLVGVALSVAERRQNASPINRRGTQQAQQENTCTIHEPPTAYQHVHTWYTKSKPSSLFFFRTAVPFWGQLHSQLIKKLSPKQDCGCKKTITLKKINTSFKISLFLYYEL